MNAISFLDLARNWSDSSDRCGTVEILEDAAAVGYIACARDPAGDRVGLSIREATTIALANPGAVYFTVSE